MTRHAIGRGLAGWARLTRQWAERRREAQVMAAGLRSGVILAALPDPVLPEGFCEGRRWRHVKRGTVYVELCRAELQAASEPLEGELMVVYRGQDGRTWVRAAGEFGDGRFEEVL